MTRSRHLWRRMVRHRRALAAAAASLLLLAVASILAIGSARAHLAAPPASVLLTDRHGAFLGQVGGNDDSGYGYWPVGKLPQRVVAATIAIEDRRFSRHPGVDLRSVGRALLQNLSQGDRVSGASTLAMQVARMQHPGPRTYLRKATEAVTALVLTARYGRTAVLRHYLTIVPYGNQVHGIAYAARRYLDKPVVDLSWAEVAFLTAIPQAPARMNPFTPAGRDRAIARGLRVLALLHSHGDLSQVELELAQQQLRSLDITRAAPRPDEALHAVLALEQRFSDPSEYRGIVEHPIVRTSIDLALQRQVSHLTLDWVSSWTTRGAGNAAVIVLDRSSREVLAWVGSTDYFNSRHAGAIDFTRVARSPGSTLKPFIYAQALERGVITPTSVLDDLQRGAGDIGNADERFLGPLLPRIALANSRNVPAANLLARIGLDNGFTMLGELGLHDSATPARHWGLGLSLGGMPVTLEQLVRAYTALADDGRLGDLVWYRRQPRRPRRRVFSEDTARLITLFLSDPMARLPTFPRAGWLEFPFPVAVKTGTSSGYHDAWTIAYSRRYLVGVWVGHPDFLPMAGLSGYHAAARIAREVVLALHADQLDGLDDISFPPPRGWVPVKLCALDGKRATPASHQVLVEYLPPDHVPQEPSLAHRRLAVDIRNSLLATPSTPRRFVEVRTFVDLGPRYADWQRWAGLPHPPFEVSQLGPTQSSLPRQLLAAPMTPPATHQVHITAPEPELAVLRDPETPPDRATLALRAVVDPPTEQLVWYVDGNPYEVVEYPYTARWPLCPGAHRFQARLPFRREASTVVQVTVY